MIVVEDALACNGPHVKLLREHSMDFSIGCKSKSSVALFAAFDKRRRRADGGIVEFEEVDDPGVVRGCYSGNTLPINVSHPDVMVNLMEFWEVNARKAKREWNWITSLGITRENALEIAAIGRSRWNIENQVCNTLKNQSVGKDAGVPHLVIHNVPEVTGIGVRFYYVQ